MSRTANNPLPYSERKYLSMKEMGQYMGIGLNRMKQIKKGWGIYSLYHCWKARESYD